MNENVSEFYRLQDEMWKEFIPNLIDAATKIQFEHKILKSDGLIIIEFFNEKSGNAIQYLHGYKDEMGGCYERFISPVCQFNDSVDSKMLLEFGSTLGISVYIDNNLFDGAVVNKYDHPNIAGYPDEIWFEYILRRLDATTTALSKMLNI
ncbi:MAG: hypothetical protein PHN88_04555 [Ignavibacteria bacterium]|nr:hypothetical protein [Ignavibacteria bacterium]